MKPTKNDLVKIFVCFILVVCCSIGFYYGYWTKRPIYSLELIHKAILDKDITTFEHYFDMDSVYTNLIDDVISQSINDEKDKSDAGLFGKTLAAGFLNSIKPTLISNNKELTRRFVKDELNEMPEETETNIYAITNNGLYDIRNSINHSNYKLSEYKYLSKSDDECLVELFILNKSAKKKSSIKVQLHRLYDGKWKVVKIFDIKHNIDKSSFHVNKDDDINTESVKQEAKDNNPFGFKLSLKKRINATERVRKVLDKADDVSYKDGKTIYQFNRKLINRSLNDYLVIRNSIEVNDKTKEIGSISSFMVFRSGESLPDWNSIVLFNDDKAAYNIDINQWEKDKKGVYINTGLHNEDGERIYNSNFSSRLSLVGDMFAKIEGEKTSLYFFKDSSVVAYFDLNSGDKVAFLDLAIMNMIIKNELKRNDGKVFLTS